MHRRLRVRQFKGDMFSCLDLLCRGKGSTGILSVLDCPGSALFIVKVYEVILHDS